MKADLLSAAKQDDSPPAGGFRQLITDHYRRFAEGEMTDYWVLFFLRRLRRVYDKAKCIRNIPIGMLLLGGGLASLCLDVAVANCQ
jgi:hypothetical protein